MTISTIPLNKAMSYISDYRPKSYLLHLTLGNVENPKHLTISFNTQLDRIMFENEFAERYEGNILALTRSEPQLNPNVRVFIDNLNKEA